MHTRAMARHTLQRLLAAVALALFFSAASGADDASPKPVANVDLQRYAGLWWEQARLPNRFQKDCTGQVTARYSLRADGRLDVLNRCARGPGDVQEILGEARPAAGAAPGLGQLQVRFAPRWLAWLPFVWGDYWIVHLDADYQNVLVGTPDHKYLWILSREVRLGDDAYRALVDKARALGYAAEQLARTPTEPELPRD